MSKHCSSICPKCGRQCQGAHANKKRTRHFHEDVFMGQHSWPIRKNSNNIFESAIP